MGKPDSRDVRAAAGGADPSDRGLADDGAYTYLWEYLVRPDAEAEFLRHYGPEGSWVRLFRRAAGYVGTRLYRDRDQPLRYLTVDVWEHRQAFEDFRRRFADDFEQLDRACALLTLREAPLGTFQDVPTPTRPTT